MDKPMTEQQVTFKSGELTLEGLLANSGGGAPPAVVCHPHPMYGGSMYNNVVEAVLAAMWRLGHATLRFNFRGVGESEGEHDGGIGEVDDARAALAFLVAETGVAPGDAVTAGYSFGASVAMRAGIADKAVNRIVAVALPIAMMPMESIVTPKRILLASGDRDSYSPIAKLKELVTKLGAGAKLEVIAGADHFFAGYEDRLAEAIESAIKST
jgi:uncharacterized protein